MQKITGGCQCGNVRYAIQGLGRASICHCRMCQKAFGNFFGPLVGALEITWTRGVRTLFRSSNRFQRGFCSQCGTPLTFEHAGGVEVSIGSLDNPELAPPTVQINAADQCSFTKGLSNLPLVTPIHNEEETEGELVSYQHPDHD